MPVWPSSCRWGPGEEEQRFYRHDMARVVGGPSVPLINTVLSFAYRTTFPGLVSSAAVAFIVVGLALALLTWSTGCAGTQAASDIMILSIAHVISFGEEGSVRADEDVKACVLLTTTFSLLALLMQAALFAVFAGKFMNPSVQLVLPLRPRVLRIDGEPHLTLRIAHPQAHMVTSLEVELSWINKSMRGGSAVIFRRQPLAFDNAPKYLSLPHVLTHRISTGPLAEAGDDLSRAGGFLTLVVTGYDEGLKTSICNYICYNMSDLSTAPWADVLSRPFYELMTLEQSEAPPGASCLRRVWEIGRRRLWHVFVRRHSPYRGGLPFRPVVNLDNFNALPPSCEAIRDRVSGAEPQAVAAPSSRRVTASARASVDALISRSRPTSNATRALSVSGQL